MSGRLITFEGIDGAGKSTQVERLAEYFSGRKMTVVKTREPGGTVISEQIRAILLDPGNRGLGDQTEVLLYAAARAQLIIEVIRPALAAGQVVLCDRFVDSTLAYQGAGRGIPRYELRPVMELATGGLEPDLTILLDLEPVQGRTRVSRGRTEDRLEQETLEFYQRVRAGFLELAAENPRRIKTIDAAQSPAAVWAEVKAAVDKIFAF